MLHAGTAGRTGLLTAGHGFSLLLTAHSPRLSPCCMPGLQGGQGFSLPDGGRDSAPGRSSRQILGSTQ